MNLQFNWFIFISTMTTLKGALADVVCSEQGNECITECQGSYWWSRKSCEIDTEGNWEYCPGECFFLAVPAVREGNIVFPSSTSQSSASSTTNSTASTTSQATTSTSVTTKTTTGAGNESTTSPSNSEASSTTSDSTTTTSTTTDDEDADYDTSSSGDSDDYLSDDEDFFGIKGTEYKYDHRHLCGPQKCFCPEASLHREDCSLTRDQARDTCENGALFDERAGHYTYICDCLVGFYGIFCEIDCADQCLNGGKCIYINSRNQTSASSTYSCQCVNGYFGKRCTHPPLNCDECDRRAQKNQCFDNNDDSDQCACLADTTAGDHGCASLKRACDRCANATGTTTCETDENEGTYKCNCANGFYGMYCQSYCADACKNGGVCKSKNSLDSFTYECECPADTIGDHCDSVVPQCTECKRGDITCLDTSYSTFKSKISGPSFDQCYCPADSNSDDGCTAEPLACYNCENQATCNTFPDRTYKCMCPTGYFGKYCQTPCASFCKNGGICQYKNDDNSFTYVCECPPNTFGDHCESEVRQCTECRREDTICLTSPPFSTPASYDTCYCPADSTSNEGCTDGPSACSHCKHEATCQKSASGRTYSCECVPGWTGQFCDVRITPCEPLCPRATTCSAWPNEIGYNCTTITSDIYPKKDSGRCLGEDVNCIGDLDLPSCDECTRGNVCYDDDIGLQWCYCPLLTTTNDHCYVDMSACGSCQNKDEGTNCTKTDPGTPAQKKEYECVCPVGYYGLHCENKCPADACKNGGDCIATSIKEKNVHDFYCRCLPGFQGPHCELEITSPATTTPATTPKPVETTTASLPDSHPCASNPCVGGCTCKHSCQREGGYVCVGGQGRLGKNCQIPAPQISCEMNSVSILIEEPFFNIEKFARSQFYLSKTSYDDPDKCLMSPVSLSKFGTPMRKLTLDSNQFSLCLQKTHDASTLNYTTLLWSNTEFPGHFGIDMPVPIMHFQCNYKTRYSVTTNIRPTVPTVNLMQYHGRQVALSIGLCKRSMCNSPCPSNLQVTGDAKYTTGEVIHVGIEANHPSHMFSKQTVATLQSVHLSCSSDREAESNKVELFSTGCTTPDGDVLSAKPTSGPLRLDRVCFSFRLSRLRSCDMFYIHTHVLICESPSRTCSDGSKTCAGSRRRRSLEPQSEENIIGPIRIVDSKPVIIDDINIEDEREHREQNLNGFSRSAGHPDVAGIVTQPKLKRTHWLENPNLVIAAGSCLIVFGVVTVSSLFFRYSYLRQRNSLSFKHH